MMDVKPVEGLPLVHRVRGALTPPAEGARPPLLALAHGVGSNENDLFEMAPDLDPRCVVVSARAPHTRAPDSYAWFNITYTPEGRVLDPEQIDASRKLYADFARAAAAAYGADPTRIYTLGFSQGAVVSLVTALSQPRLFAGVIALSGRIPPEALPLLATPAETAGQPVFMAHGSSDMVIRVEDAHTACDILHQQQADLTYREYMIDHRINQQMYDEMTLWLRQRLDASELSR